MLMSWTMNFHITLWYNTLAVFFSSSILEHTALPKPQWGPPRTNVFSFEDFHQRRKWRFCQNTHTFGHIDEDEAFCVRV
jgi:hypothetical protein